MAHSADETAMNGTVIFHNSKPAMVNGEKVVTKQRTLLGSKLFKLARLPNPKKESNVRNKKKYERRSWVQKVESDDGGSADSNRIQTANATTRMAKKMASYDKLSSRKDGVSVMTMPIKRGHIFDGPINGKVSGIPSKQPKTLKE